MSWLMILILSLAATACSKEIGGIANVDDAERLSYEATTTRSGDGEVKTVVSVTNATNDEIVAAIGGVTCQFRVLAYTDASRTGEPIWNEEDWRREQGFGCTYEQRRTTFLPGESVTYETVLPVADLRASAPIPDGRYYFVAAVHEHSGGVGELNFIRVPAGELQIEK